MARVPIDEQVDPCFMAADAECDDVARLAAQLTGVHRLAEQQRDRALSAMVVAADEMGVRWDRELRYVKLCEEELRRARDSAAISQRRLAVLLDVIEEAAGVPSVESVVDPVERQRPRRRLFGSGRRTARPEPAEHRPDDAVEGLYVIEGRSSSVGKGHTAVRVAPKALRTQTLDGHVDHVDHVDQVELSAEAPNQHDAIRPPDDVDLAIHFLGAFRLLQRGEPVDTSHNAKGLRVLKYLLCHRDCPVPNDVLIDLFWPESDLDSGGRRLHQAIYTLRKMLGCGIGAASQIVFENGVYLINPKLSVWSDVGEFESSAAAGRLAALDGRIEEAMGALSRAVRCYQGDFLADSPYEEWAIGDRERLRLLYVDVANRLGDLLFETGDIDASFAVSRKLLRHEPCDEATHRRLIRCYGATGRRNLVIRQYRAYVDCAERLYGLGPSPETTALYKSLIAD